MNSSDNNFTIRDNSSEFAKYLPEKWIEPLLIISRIRNYSGIDDYILALIKSRLQMFVDTSDTIEFDEFQEYMHNTIMGKDVPNEWAHNKQQEEVEDEDKKESRSNSSNNNDGYRKFVKDVNKSIIEFPSKEEVEKRFGKIPPDEDEEKAMNHGT